MMCGIQIYRQRCRLGLFVAQKKLYSLLLLLNVLRVPNFSIVMGHMLTGPGFGEISVFFPSTNTHDTRNRAYLIFFALLYCL